MRACFRSKNCQLFLITILFSGVVFAQEVNLPKAPLNICYVSLNNAKEFELTKTFVGKLEKTLGIDGYIKVHEFQKKNTYPEESFKALANSGVKCDGTIISGHNTGSFGGSQASGYLRIDYLEELSCKPETSEWFSNVQALWLQGCRTLGAASEAQGNTQNMAEYHANRVYEVRDADHLDQNELELADGFASLLDLESPYAVRFFKTFPNAKVFGWTKTAPGENARSERSFLFHIANTARRIHENQGTPFSDLQDPVKTYSFNKFSAASYFNAIVQVLGNEDRLGIEDALGGWMDHGQPPNIEKALWGFDNNYLNSYPPLMSSSDEVMVSARELDCNLRNAQTTNEITGTLRSILKSNRSIGLSFYTLRSVFRDNGDDVVKKRAIREALGESKNFSTFIKGKLSNKHIGLERKIDYFGLFTETTG